MLFGAKDLLLLSTFLLYYVSASSVDQDYPYTAAGDHLLMPIWAYRIAAGYLISISLIGLILNVIVIIVLLNDPKVSVNF